jgi:hypothetical protein
MLNDREDDGRTVSGMEWANKPPFKYTMMTKLDDRK